MTQNVTAQTQHAALVLAVQLRGGKCLNVSGSVMHSAPAQQSLRSVQMSEATLNLRVV